MPTSMSSMSSMSLTANPGARAHQGHEEQQGGGWARVRRLGSGATARVCHEISEVRGTQPGYDIHRASHD